MRRPNAVAPLKTMSKLRTRSVGAKVTDAEYEALTALAGANKVSEVVRHVLQQALARTGETEVLLAEILALRTILLNLHFAVCNGEPVTTETLHRLIARADQDKAHAAKGRLVGPLHDDLSTSRRKP